MRVESQVLVDILEFCNETGHNGVVEGRSESSPKGRVLGVGFSKEDGATELPSLAVILWSLHNITCGHWTLLYKE